MFRICLAFIVVVLAGCASAPKAPVVVDMPLSEARALAVFDGATGDPVGWSELVNHAAATDVVIVGENHGHPVGLPWAAALWEDISAQSPHAALSLEFFERDDQSRLDDYLLGLTDEAAFKRRTERKVGNYPPSHELMVKRAKELGLPVIAANAPWELIRFLRGKDYDSLRKLTAEQQRLFRIPEADPEGRYRADFDRVMSPMVSGAHAPPKPGQPAPPELTDEQKKARLDAAFRSQHLWDWTMADSIVQAAEAGRHPVVHIIGRFHSDYFGGTPQAVQKLRPGTRMVIISVVDEASDLLQAKDRGRADYVVYVGPAPGQ